jgi:hypothetical protein
MKAVESIPVNIAGGHSLLERIIPSVLAGIATRHKADGTGTPGLIGLPIFQLPVLFFSCS